MASDAVVLERTDAVQFRQRPTHEGVDFSEGLAGAEKLYEPLVGLDDLASGEGGAGDVFFFGDEHRGMVQKLDTRHVGEIRRAAVVNISIEASQAALVA
jgi:hypothetical protein